MQWHPPPPPWCRWHHAVAPAAALVQVASCSGTRRRPGAGGIMQWHPPPPWCSWHGAVAPAAPDVYQPIAAALVPIAPPLSRRVIWDDAKNRPAAPICDAVPNNPLYLPDPINMTNQPAAPAYEVLVSYPLASMHQMDDTIARLAHQYGGFDRGGGAGFGERDLVFLFPLFNAQLIAFLSACLPLPGVRVQIKQATAPFPGSLGIQS